MPSICTRELTVALGFLGLLGFWSDPEARTREEEVAVLSVSLPSVAAGIPLPLPVAAELTLIDELTTSNCRWGRKERTWTEKVVQLTQ